MIQDNKRSMQVIRFMLLFFFMAVAHVMLGQSLSDFESALETEEDSFNNIARICINIILVLGAIGVIYAYATKRQDARDYLIYYLIAVVVLGVIRTTVLGGN